MTGFWLGTVASSLSLDTEQFGDLFLFDNVPDKELSLPTDFNGTGIFFKPDGTKVFFCNLSDQIHEYSLSTAWDISTATATTSTTVSNNTRDLYIDQSGTRLFYLSTDGTVRKHGLNTAWNLSTITSEVQGYELANLLANCQSLWFKKDGTRVYVGSAREITINTVDYIDPIISAPLSTAWDLSTFGSNSAVSLRDLLGGSGVTPNGLSLVNNGSEVIFCDNASDQIIQLNLSTPYDITTASLSRSFSTSADMDNIGGLTVSEENPNEIYLMGLGDFRVLQYSKEFSTPTMIFSDSVLSLESIASPSFPSFEFRTSVTSQELDAPAVVTLTLSLSAASVGDLCVLWDHRRNESSTSVPASNTPSGWTLIGTSSGNYSNEFRSDYCFKILDSNDISNGVTGGQAEDRYMRAYIFSTSLSTVTARDFTTQSTIGNQALQTQNISTLSSSAPVVAFGFKMTYGGTHTASFTSPSWGTEFTSSSFGISTGGLASGFTIQLDTLSDIDVDANDEGNAQELTSFHLEIS